MRIWPALLFAIVAGSPAASAPLLANAIQGVYKVRHKIAMYDGSLPAGQFHTVEDVLEIVALPHGGAYLRVHSVFDNGHICGFHGIAKPEGDALVYRPHDNIEGKCALALRRKGDRLVFEDKGDACKYDFCGMRGGFEGASVPLSSRRPIRYMPRLLASREYAEAMTEAGLAAPPPHVAIKAEPMYSEGAHVRFPRLAVFPDKMSRINFNSMMARDEAQDRADRLDCLAFLRAHHQEEARPYRVEMRVTYLTPRYLSMTLTANRRCAGAPAEDVAEARTIDLSTSDDVNWRAALKPEFFADGQGDHEKGELTILYRAHYPSPDSECRNQIGTSSMEFALWIDARRGLVAQPNHGIYPRCALAVTLPLKDVAPYADDARLMSDLNATIPIQD